MKPNIDRRGRIARGISGGLWIVAGVTMLIVGWPESAAWRWGVSLFSLAFGGFQLYEAKCSWCVMRACGVKTPM